MKKFIVLIAVTLWSIQNVCAVTYYDPNVNVIEYEENPLGDVEVELRYPFYRLEKSYGDYVSKENQGESLLDFDDFTYTSWVYSSAYPEEKEGREIKEETTYYVSRRKKVRYFFLYDVSGSNGLFKISELSFFVYGEKIEVSYDCGDCSSILQNDVYKENPYIISNGSVIKVDLNGEYDMEDLSIHYGLFNDGYDSMNYSMVFDTSQNLEPYPYYRTTQSHFFHNSNVSEISMLEITKSSFALVQDQQDFYASSNPVEEDDKTFVQKVTDYYYRDILYHEYVEYKVYCNGYLKEGTEECPIKEEPGKLFYIQKQQNRIEISDYTILYSGESLEEKLILYSDVPYEIRGDINFEISGIYEVEVVTPFSDTFHTIQVINYKKEIEDYQSLIEGQKKEIEQLKEKTLNDRKEIEWLQKKVQELQDLSFHQEEQLNEKEKRVLDFQKSIKEKEESEKNLENQIQFLLKDSTKKEEAVSCSPCKKCEETICKKKAFPFFLLGISLLSIIFLFLKRKKH